MELINLVMCQNVKPSIMYSSIFYCFGAFRLKLIAQLRTLTLNHLIKIIFIQNIRLFKYTHARSHSRTYITQEFKRTIGLVN